MISAFGVYKLWIVLKLHFQQSEFDAIKYNWTIGTLAPSALEKRRDRFIFEKVARKYQTKEKVIDVLISNFCQKGKLDWIGDLDEDVYEEWTKKIASLPYIFKNQVDNIFSSISTADEFMTLVYDKSTDKSKLFDDLLSGNICIETFIVLDNIFKICKTIDSSMQFRLLWETYKPIIQKYQRLLNKLYLTPDDNEKMRKIVKQHVKMIADSNGSVQRKSAA